MKKLNQNYIRLLIILIMIVISIFAWSNLEKVDRRDYVNGVYFNQAYGYHSDISVSVTIKEGHIYNIEILSHEEPEILANVVFEKLPQEMIKYNKAQVDIVTGATYTSNSLIEAVEKALEEATE